MSEFDAESVIEELQTAFEAAGDPDRSVQMAAYMRDQFAFFGIAARPRRDLQRGVLAGRHLPSEADLVAVASRCWERPEREFQYFACDLIGRRIRDCSPEFVEVLSDLITTRSWWDTVDALAVQGVGALVRRNPDLSATMDRWIRDSNLWIVRSAILHQNRYKGATDADRLFAYCTRQAEHPDFFVRKAIGWALREYARTDPEAVRSFVDTHPELAPLSRREALKNI